MPVQKREPPPGFPVREAFWAARVEVWEQGPFGAQAKPFEMAPLSGVASRRPKPQAASCRMVSLQAPPCFVSLKQRSYSFSVLLSSLSAQSTFWQRSVFVFWLVVLFLLPQLFSLLERWLFSR